MLPAFILSSFFHRIEVCASWSSFSELGRRWDLSPLFSPLKTWSPTHFGSLRKRILFVPFAQHQGTSYAYLPSTLIPWFCKFFLSNRGRKTLEYILGLWKHIFLHSPTIPRVKGFMNERILLRSGLICI